MAKQSREVKYLVTSCSPGDPNSWWKWALRYTLKDARSEARSLRRDGFGCEITRVETTTKIDCVYRSVPKGAK